MLKARNKIARLPDSTPAECTVASNSTYRIKLEFKPWVEVEAVIIQSSSFQHLQKLNALMEK
jgi:hypothetical protein